MGCVYIDCEQGSEEWTKARLGRFTASRFSDLMANGRSKGSLGATAKSYIIEVLGEQLTGKPADQVRASALEWGKDNEDQARASYQFETGLSVTQVGFAIHEQHPLFGASSDGLVGTDGGIEIKCPMVVSNHLKYLLSPSQIPAAYQWQMQGGMWIMDREWCDFVSYHPDITEDCRLHIYRVERDDEMIAQLEERAALAADYLLSIKERL